MVPTERKVALALSVILIAFLIAVFFFFPNGVVVSSPQYAILTLFSMFLSGLVGYLITGSITADLDWKLPSGLTIKVSSAGAFAFAIVGLVIFLHFSPVQSASQAVEQIQSSLSDKAKTSLQT